jgi:spore coat polysaccharide biosynthesis predicted glycosyltransferase SpsG
VLIIDLPFHNGAYSKELESKDSIVLIDDLGKIDVYSQFLINGSIVKKFHDYSIKNKSTKTLFGPNFMLLRKDFLENRNKVRISDKPIKKILLVFGGSDDKNLTCKILPILLKRDYEVTIVLGPTNRKKNEVNELIKNHSNVKIETNVEMISDLFSKQDLVISASGITVYELATLGIPTIMVPIDDAQKETAKSMEIEGFGINYGSWDDNPTKFETMLLKMDDYDLRKHMHEVGRKIVDGSAVLRISDILLTLV